MCFVPSRRKKKKVKHPLTHKIHTSSKTLHTHTNKNIHASFSSLVRLNRIRNINNRMEKNKKTAKNDIPPKKYIGLNAVYCVVCGKKV